MRTVWLLFNEMDYESATVHSVYAEKPDTETFAQIIKDSFGYPVYDPTYVNLLANELVKRNEVRVMDLYTWTLDERAVV